MTTKPEAQGAEAKSGVAFEAFASRRTLVTRRFLQNKLAVASLAVLVALFWLLEGLRRLDARWPVVRRVLGAWVAAFALLVGALLYVALFGRAR